ncbi:hypothetical protein [Sphingobium sp. WCS2017Hpa-17]|uniref:hypothetical protein n=1 Tax=Sphingobium sp. WCS2017Hpa-17 TaxID=3073638 RepID=UPI00288C466F|nr:hypothetical protein [Sphingobium sp. WCS2017Hpa-17]
MMIVSLPFPPAILSGHTGGDGMGKWKKIKEVQARRALAKAVAQAALRRCNYRPSEAGDIGIRITFTPPDNRGDRVNFAARMKAYVDGIAEALGVNDKRFLPSYEFRAAEKPGQVVVEVVAA